MFSKVGAGLFVLLWSAVLAGPALADCGLRTKTLTDTLRTGDLVRGERLVDEILHAKECGPADARAAKLALAEQMLAEADRVHSPEDVARLVEKAAALEVSWAAARALGELRARRRAYAEAARSFQRAIEIVAASDDPTLKTRLRNELVYLARRAEETRHLAAAGANPILVRAPEGRDGNLGGVFSPVLDRGPEATRIPSPILFVYKSDDFTPVGRQAAEEFVALLKERAPSAIVVTGHTDRVGSDAYNLDLSKKRAEKVAAFLRSNGVTGKIAVAWKGRSEPRVLSDPSAYTQDQIDELNRRVEFDWKP